MFGIIKKIFSSLQRKTNKSSCYAINYISIQKDLALAAIIFAGHAFQSTNQQTEINKKPRTIGGAFYLSLSAKQNEIEILFYHSSRKESNN
jgi:hypothetical protein